MAEQRYDSIHTGQQIDAAVSWLQIHAADQICGGVASGATIATPDNPTYWFASQGTYTCGGSTTITITNGSIGIISYDGSQWSSVSFYVGEAVYEEESFDETNLVKGKYWKLSEEYVPETVNTSSYYGCMFLSVVAGDFVEVKSQGNNGNARAWGISDTTRKILSIASGTEPVSEILNVEETGFVFINCLSDYYGSFQVKLHHSRIDNVVEELENTNERIDNIEQDIYVEEEPEWTLHSYYNTNDNHTIGDDCPPKSGGANSDYDCLDVDLTQDFTKIEFSCKGHWASAQHYQACAYFFLDSNNKIVDIADTSDYTYLENIYNISLKPSDIPEGAVKLCLNNKTRGSYAYATPSCVITKIKGGSSPVPVDTTDIIYLNPDAENILSDVSLVKANGNATVLTIAHITDTHGEDVNIERFNRFCNYYGINTRLHTGDIVRAAYNLDDFDQTKYNELFADTMVTIGNHDTANHDGSFDWSAHQGIDSFNRYIAPLYDGWGAILADSASTNGYCYYYKDFADKKIRLIVLDAMAHLTSQSSGQNTWFAARLADTLDSNNTAYDYDVIVAYHYIPSSIDLFEFPFTSKFGIEGVASHSDVVDIVTSFITDGGKFIAWLTGHTHRDYCGKIVRTVNGNTINQVVLSAATGGADASNQDCARVVGEKSQDLFSIYGIDTTRKLIKIYRVGCDYDVWCRHKETACINYETAEVVIDEEEKDNVPTANSEKGVKSGGIYTELAGKQATLVSGTNIKTINNQSLLGSGDLSLAEPVSVVEVTGATPTQELQPNTFYKFGSVTSLTVTLAAGVTGMVSIYAFSFIAGQANPTITLPQGVVCNQTLSLAQGDKCEFSIMDNLAVFQTWS